MSDFHPLEENVDSAIALDGKFNDGFCQSQLPSPSEVHRASTWKRVAVGSGMLAAAAATVWGIASGVAEDARAEYGLQYTPAAQEAVNSIDGILANIGTAALPTALTVVGAVKLASRRSPMLHAMDRESSKELADDGRRSQRVGRRALSALVAGTIPAVATGAVGLATFTAAIGTEVTEGPSRPIERLFDEIAPAGRTLVIGYDTALPMTESNLSRPFVAAIQAEAAERNVNSVIIDQYLGTMVYGDQNRTNLVIGLQMPPGSELSWSPQTDADKPIPVAVDRAANVPLGASVLLNGVPALVVQHTEGGSAINRIGVIADREAIAAKLDKAPGTAPDDAVILETGEIQAEDILAEARKSIDETSAVVTKEEYIKNSEEFWESNVKPVTNVLALVSGATALISVAGIMSSRLLRNRRELAAKLAQGVPVAYVRATELLRATKDGIAASIAGTAAAAAGTPLANALESGFNIAVGYKEVMVGFAVGVLGTVGGAAARLLRLRKVVNPSEDTRA